MPREVQLALGRIFSMGSRPTQPGDVECYEACRALILDYAESQGQDLRSDHVHNYVRDRFRGAAGD